MKFRNKRDVDDLRKKKLNLIFFLNSYSSDDGKLILFENDNFVTIGAELICFLCLKVLNCLWIEKFEIKLILFQVELMMNGESNGSLELLIKYLECIQIDFRGTGGVSFVGDVKI